MALSLTLEDFETARPAGAPVAPAEPEGPGDDWLAGYAEGLAAGRAEAAARQDALSHALVQTVADMGFAQAEARQILIGELAPLFEALATVLLPGISRDLLAPHLLDTLMDAAREDMSRAIVLHVATADVVAVSDCLASTPALPFVWRSDPALLPGQARVSGASGETSLDVGGLVAGIRSILSALFDAPQKEASHG